MAHAIAHRAAGAIHQRAAARLRPVRKSAERAGGLSYAASVAQPPARKPLPSITNELSFADVGLTSGVEPPPPPRAPLPSITRELSFADLVPAARAQPPPPPRAPLPSITRELTTRELGTLVEGARPADEHETAALGGAEMDALLTSERATSRAVDVVHAASYPASAAAERAAAERAAAERAPAERAPAERAAIDQTAADRAFREWAAIGQPAVDRAAAERAATERAAADQAAAYRAFHERAAAEQAAADRAFRERATRPSLPEPARLPAVMLAPEALPPQASPAVPFAPAPAGRVALASAAPFAPAPAGSPALPTARESSPWQPEATLTMPPSVGGRRRGVGPTVFVALGGATLLAIAVGAVILSSRTADETSGTNHPGATSGTSAGNATAPANGTSGGNGTTEKNGTDPPSTPAATSNAAGVAATTTTTTTAGAPAAGPEAEARAALGRLRDGVGACTRDVIGVLPGTSPPVPSAFVALKGGAYQSVPRDFRSPVFACTKYRETEAQRFQIQWQLTVRPSQGRGVAWLDDDGDGRPDRALGFSAKLLGKKQVELGEIAPLDPMPAPMKAM